jgi:protein transport protein SEC23
MLLPEQALVGLITFGKNVHIHELSFDECPKSYVFRGDKELSASQIATFLGLRAGSLSSSVKDQKSAPATPAAAASTATGAGAANTTAASVSNLKSSRFLLPVSQCEFQLNAILEDLSKDCW